VTAQLSFVDTYSQVKQKTHHDILDLLSRLFSEESAKCDTRVESHTRGAARDQIIGL